MSAAERQHWISVDEGVFSEAVVLKALYWLSGRYVVEIRRDKSNQSLQVGITSPSGAWTVDAAQAVEARLRRDLIDFRTREIIEMETRTVRELLVAKAFDDAGQGPDQSHEGRPL